MQPKPYATQKKEYQLSRSDALEVAMVLLKDMAEYSCSGKYLRKGQDWVFKPDVKVYSLDGKKLLCDYRDDSIDPTHIEEIISTRFESEGGFSIFTSQLCDFPRYKIWESKEDYFERGAGFIDVATAKPIVSFKILNSDNAVLEIKNSKLLYLDPAIIHNVAEKYMLNQSNHGLLDKLINLGIPEERLDPVIKMMERSDPSDINKTTDTSFTGLVIDFDLDSYHIFAKIGNNKAMLEREKTYMELAREYSLMRPFTTILYDYKCDSNFGALLIYDAKENPRLVPREDYVKYYSLRGSVINSFLKKHSFCAGRSDLAVLIDIFNMAVSHVYMSDHLDNPVFVDHLIEPVASFDKLEMQLMSSDSGEARSSLRPFLSAYRNVEARAQSYVHSAPIIIGNYDSTLGNIFDRGLGARVIGDYGLVVCGTPEFVLGARGATNSRLVADAYCNFIGDVDNYRQMTDESYAGRKFFLNPADLAEQTRDITFAKAFRMACFKAMVGGEFEEYLPSLTKLGPLLQ